MNSWESCGKAYRPILCRHPIRSEAELTAAGRRDREFCRFWGNNSLRPRIISCLEPCYAYFGEPFFRPGRLIYNAPRVSNQSGFEEESFHVGFVASVYETLPMRMRLRRSIGVPVHA